MSDQLFVRYCSNPNGHAPKDCPDRMPRPLNGCMGQAGECESCNRLAEAFEAMREALTRINTEALRGDYVPSAFIVDMARAALALADAVSKVSR